MFRSTHFTVVLSLAVGALLGTANAGYKDPLSTYAVSVNLTSRNAYAYIGHARNTANTVEYVNCNIYTSAGVANGQCVFRNYNNVSAACTTSDPDLIQAIGFVQGDGYVSASWDTTGKCTQISTISGSWLGPKAP